MGAARDDGSAGNDQGSAYVFIRDGVTWSQQAKVTSADPGSFDYFGASVGISGESAVVGALYADGPDGIPQGAAYVFVRMESAGQTR